MDSLIAFYDAKHNDANTAQWTDLSGHNRHMTPRTRTTFVGGAKPHWSNNPASSTDTSVGFDKIVYPFQSRWAYYLLWFYNTSQVNIAYPRIVGVEPIDRPDFSIREGMYAASGPAGWQTHQVAIQNAWQAVVLNVDTVLPKQSIYLNGSANVVDRNNPGVWPALPVAFTIGNRTDYNGEAVVGLYGLVAIYNRTLTETEIDNIYARLPVGIW